MSAGGRLLPGGDSSRGSAVGRISIGTRTLGRGRDLALFQLYRFLSTSYLFAPVIVVFFHGSRGLSMTEITLLNSVYCVTAMLFEVPTGVLADRWGRRKAMVLGSLMMAAGCLLDYAGHSFAVFAVGEGLLALGMTLTSGADSAYLYDLLLDAGREYEYRTREGAASAAKLVGAAAALAAGGWLARRDVAATYLVTAAICLCASGVALLLKEAPPAVPPRKAALLTQMVDGVRTVLVHPPLRFAVMFSALVFTLVRMSIYLHQPYLSSAGFSLPAVGGVLAVLSFGAALGAYRVDLLRRYFGERGLVLLLPATLTVTYLFLGIYSSTWCVGLLVLQGVANGVYSPLSKELLNREIADSSQRATVLSVESMVRRLVFGCFAPVAGLVVDRSGLPGGLFLCASLGVAGTVALAVHVVRRRVTFGQGFEGERTPTPLPELEAAAALESSPSLVPAVSRIAASPIAD